MVFVMIYAIVMAGGRGTRLKTPVEKPLFKLQNKPEAIITRNWIENALNEKFNLGNITQKEYKKQLKKIKSQKRKMETIFNEIVRIKELKGDE